MPKGNAKSGGSATATSALEKAVQKARSAVAAVMSELEAHDLESLTPDDRLHSSGRLRDGEGEAMLSILDTVDAHPGLFAALAPHDHGNDDNAVETAPARAALARRALLAPLAKDLDTLLTRVSDDMMSSGEKAKDVTVPAYGIIKASAAIAPALRKAAAPAIGFYAKAAKQPRKKGPDQAAPKG
ncbi:hypothetical protein A7982_12885 [Minicystis rosea]|nr:hypothetical protein A7982_12885 [Minicystis rosea]